MSSGSSAVQPMTAMTPLYQCPRSNQPFVVYKGPVEVVQLHTTVPGQIEVMWTWFPLPEISFTLAVDPRANLNLGDCLVRLPPRNIEVVATIISVNIDVVPGVSSKRIKVLFDRPAVFDDGAQRSSVQFQVVNFVNYHGLWIAPAVGSTGTNVRPGRIELLGGGWRITVDAVDDIVKVIESLHAESGYALTHTGKIERADGGTFTSQQLHELDDALFDFLSFAKGSWSANVLPTEVDASGTGKFRLWQVPKLSMWKFRESWFSPMHPKQLVDLFPGFLARWSDPQWRDAVRFSIHALVESNAESGSMESSLILGQVALELLSAAILVEDLKKVTVKDFDNKSLWPAFRKFQDLLAECGIPLAIPPSLNHLSAVAAANKWVDGPTALTQTRNKLAHASLPNLKKLYAIDAAVKSDLRSLVLWYVELVLLWWFGYKGGYRSRVDPPSTPYTENAVPWAPPPPPPAIVTA